MESCRGFNHSKPRQHHGHVTPDISDSWRGSWPIDDLIESHFRRLAHKKGAFPQNGSPAHRHLHPAFVSLSRAGYPPRSQQKVTIRSAGSTPICFPSLAPESRSSGHPGSHLSLLYPGWRRQGSQVPYPFLYPPRRSLEEDMYFFLGSAVVFSFPTGFFFLLPPTPQVSTTG